MNLRHDPHRIRIRVYYEDTDVSGVTYHASYLRWLERGRTEWLRAQGHGQQGLMKDHGIAFTISRIALDFLRPARLDDEVEIETAVVQRRRASLAFDQRVRLDGSPLVNASVRVACVDSHSFKPVALPPDLIA